MSYVLGSVFVLNIAGLVTGLLGFASDYWIRFEYKDVYGNIVVEYRGLWRSCADSVDTRVTFCFTSEVQSKCLNSQHSLSSKSFNQRYLLSKIFFEAETEIEACASPRSEIHCSIKATY